MQLWVLGLVLGIVLHDAASVARTTPATPLLSGNALLASFLIPKIVLAVAYGLLCRFTIRRLHQSRGFKYLNRLDRVTSLYRTAVLGLYMADLYFGALLVLRRQLGDLFGVPSPATDRVILIDELLFLLPPLLLLVFSWWAYYPIDRRLREASLIRMIDAGIPIHPIWTRGQYLLSQVRHQIALILVPLLFLIAWSELVELTMPSALFGNGSIDPRPGIQMAGAACIFLFAPVMIRHLWDTCPLPDGELRERLTAMCSHHRVGVRELLLWRTYSGVINAAVMGLVRPLRFILLTDALLEQLTRTQVEAVMAHELAHVRRHHLFWLLAVAGLLLVTLTNGWWLVLGWIDPLWMTESASVDHSRASSVSKGAPLVLSLLCWLVLFGWVSRRFEREADTFAVQHLVHEADDGTDDTNEVNIDEASVTVMVDALQRVADLNHMPTRRRSWRHGSIAWRQRYLRTLVGLPTTRLDIERHVFWIKLLTGLGIFATIAIYWYAEA